MNIEQYNKILFECSNWQLIVFGAIITISLMIYALYNCTKEKCKTYVKVLIVVFGITPLIAGAVRMSMVLNDYNNPIEYEGTYMVEEIYVKGRALTPYAEIYLEDKNERITLIILSEEKEIEEKTYYGKLIYAKHIKALFYWEGNIIGS